MAIPEGYVALDFVGFTDRGAYSSNATYMINDLTHDAYNSIWRCLRDGTSNVAPSAGAYWSLFIGASNSLVGTTATDTSGVLGSAGQVVVAQYLVDAIADKVMNSLVNKSQIINNVLATTTGNVLDAAQGKLLQDKITSLNSDLVTLNSYEITPTNIGIKLYYRKLGPCKSIYAAGTHTVEWTAGTTYGLATVGGIYTPSYSWSKRIPYKTSGNVHFATLSMDTSGQLTITPETVGIGGTLRIHEMYF